VNCKKAIDEQRQDRSCVADWSREAEKNDECGMMNDELKRKRKPDYQ
jgi:hypothetical protein